jgi:hypothetical protein
LYGTLIAPTLVFIPGVRRALVLVVGVLGLFLRVELMNLLGNGAKSSEVKDSVTCSSGHEAENGRPPDS